MKPWKDALRDAVVTGTAASLASTAALAVCGVAEIDRPFAPTNAVSHWYWGDRATRKDRFSIRHTVLGYLTHNAASILWAVWYEKLFGARRAGQQPVAALGDAAAIAALAYFVDYRLTPRRLMPGFEQRLSRRSLFAVYACFGAGLALGGALLALVRGEAR
jgi:hypothetical protein